MIRRYNKLNAETPQRETSTTYTFFEKLNNPNAGWLHTHNDLYEFILDGFEVETRAPKTAYPNFLAFCFVLHTSGKEVEEELLFNAWEVAIANRKVPDEDLSRYAWGVLKQMEGRAA